MKSYSSCNTVRNYTFQESILSDFSLGLGIQYFLIWKRLAHSLGDAMLTRCIFDSGNTINYWICFNKTGYCRHGTCFFLTLSCFFCILFRIWILSRVFHNSFHEWGIIGLVLSVLAMDTLYLKICLNFE